MTTTRPFFSCGDAILVRSGLFAGKLGRVVDVEDGFPGPDCSLKVEIPAFGGKLVLDVRGDEVRLAAPADVLRTAGPTGR